MVRGWHYTKLSLSSALLLFFFWHVCFVLLFLYFCRLCLVLFIFSCSRWSFVDAPVIFSCPADHVPDWQPRSILLLGMVEAHPIG